jgi:hypothetical protein
MGIYALYILDFVSLALLMVCYYRRYETSVIPFFFFQFLLTFIHFLGVKYSGLIFHNPAEVNIIYNLVPILCIAYYHFVFISYFKNKSTRLKLIIVSILWALFLVLFINLHTPQNKTYLFFEPFLIGMSIAFLFVFLYLRDLINDDVVRNIFRQPLFWFSMSILLYYIMFIPALFLFSPEYSTLFLGDNNLFKTNPDIKSLLDSLRIVGILVGAVCRFIAVLVLFKNGRYGNY